MQRSLSHCCSCTGSPWQMQGSLAYWRLSRAARHSTTVLPKQSARGRRGRVGWMTIRVEKEQQNHEAGKKT